MKVRIGWTQNGYVDAVSHSADVDGGEFGTCCRRGLFSAGNRRLNIVDSPLPSFSTR
jgi:hypothetical protein